MASVLIVDDSRTARRVIREALEADGHTVVGEAGNGEDGYLKYKELKPDIVTMDIIMPGLDGLEALQLIRQSDTKAKVIIMTAAGQREKVGQAMEMGAASFLFKPCTGDEIRQAVNKEVNA